MNNLFSSMGSGSSGAPAPKASSTSATIFGGYGNTQTASNVTPWLIGGAVVAIIAVAAVIIAAVRR